MNEKLDYFIERTDRDIAEIKEDVKQLLTFKWQIVSWAGVVGVIAGAAVQMIAIYLKLK